MNVSDLQQSVPPQAIEAEQCVIGGMLTDNDAADKLGELQSSDFFRTDHRVIFDAIISSITAGVGADTITIYERLHAKGQADRVGGLAYLNALAQDTPSAANVGRYAAIVRDRAQQRGLLAASADIEASVLANHTGADAATMIDRAATQIEALAQARVRREPKLAAQGLAEHLNVLERRSTGMERVIQTGFVDLDKALNGGLRPGWSVILAARPGMGKSALGLNIAAHVAEGHSVLFCSMEMPEPELHDRLISSLGGIALDAVMQPEENDTEFWNLVTTATIRIRDLKLYIDDQPALRLLDLRSKARAVKRKHGLDLLIVDYVQLMTGSGANRNAEIEVISRGLKSLAKELDIAVLTLAQLNRKSEERVNKLPLLSDLRDSGSLEQDADAVIFIHREEVANPDCEPQWRGFAQLRIAKFRHGRTTDVGLRYQGEFVRFVDHDGPLPSATIPKNRGGFQ